MSWFIGGIGKFSDRSKSIVNSLSSNELCSFTSGNFFLRAGGNTKTCIWETGEENHDIKNWLAVGLGISAGSEKKFLDKVDWRSVVENGLHNEVDGHFVLLKWDDRDLEIITDRIGLRDFYYCRDENNNILFSTRADWLAEIVPSKIDFSEFGGRWLLHNQVSHKSVIKNINRVVCGSSVKINLIEKKITLAEKNWIPEIKGKIFSKNDFYNELNQLITFPLSDSKLSLSFSGGLDSRFLFSILANNNKSYWYSHSFGQSNHPDSIIARNICKDNNVNHKQIDLGIPDPETFVNELTEYSGQTLVNNSASLFLQQRNYNWFMNKDEVLIDGGYGEIWRRQFNNKLVLLGAKEIRNHNYKNVLPFIKYYRADFFSADIKREMEIGCEKQIHWLFDLLPNPNKIGTENWIDLYSIKTRLVNCYLHEQSRIDAIIPCYTPFVQPSLIQNILLLDSDEKKNGRLFKKYIRKNSPRLAKYNLVKGEIPHPFWMTALQSRTWCMLKKRSLKENISVQIKLINKLRDYIADRLISKDVIESGIYNLTKLAILNESVRNFSTDRYILNELDWWLAFEMFRRKIYGN